RCRSGSRSRSRRPARWSFRTFVGASCTADCDRREQAMRWLLTGVCLSCFVLPQSVRSAEGFRVPPTVTGMKDAYKISFTAAEPTDVEVAVLDANAKVGLGADEVIDYRAERFEERVRDVDAVFDAVGGDTLRRSWGVLRPGGRLVTIAASEDGSRDERTRAA